MMLLARRAVRPSSLLLVMAAVLPLLTIGCIWRVYTFHGGGLPSEIKTVAVVPFQNETPSPELQRELAEGLRKAFSSRLGLREASEDKASAIVRGTIVKYDVDVPIAFSSNPSQATSARRRLQLVIDVEIVDPVRGKTYWSRKGLTAQGDYAESDEVGGRKQAVERIINDVIEGAQSQW